MSSQKPGSSPDVGGSGEVAGSKVLSGLLAVAFILILTILYTDKNLQTDFGIVKPYFLHWWGLAATAVVDLAGSVIFSVKATRVLVKLGAVWSWLMVVFLVADIATYKLVGFSSPGEFAKYLFYPVHYPGALPYIPGLYDVLFAVYVVSAVYASIIVTRPAAGRATL